MSADDHAWQEAASFALRAHAGQKRRDGATPYAAHPVRVALTVRHVFECDDPVCLAAALLHDVIEDTDADFDDIHERFGAETAGCVATLTKDMRLPEAERERAYDEALARADWRAKLVKLADVFDNLHDVGKGGLEKCVENCRRALAAARRDEQPPREDTPALRRAIALVEAAVVRHGADRYV